MYATDRLVSSFLATRAKHQRIDHHTSACDANLETRARNPLWRLAEALGNTGDFCMKISTFGSSTPLDIYK
jgi:hypothetical protein